MRTTNETITFARPFRLSGVEGWHPAGSYDVQTDEEQIDGLSFLAYRRVSTTIFIPLRHTGAASVEAVIVEPKDLEAALARDRAEVVQLSRAAEQGVQMSSIRPGRIQSTPALPLHCSDQPAPALGE